MSKPSPKEPLAVVPGLVVHGRHECLERVQKKSTEISLLARGDGPEVMVQKIAPGRWITLPASPESDGFEFYYVLSGSLDIEVDERPIAVRRGQFMTVSRLDRDVYLKTETGVTVLYVSSRPVFHELSEEINELLDLARTIEGKDPYLGNHCERMERLAAAVGEELRLWPGRMHLLIYAAFLHDIGKADIPEAILLKKGPLTPEEWRYIHLHPTFGRERLERTYLKDAGIIIEQHHERHDGRGYPRGLRADEILLEAQIVAAVDALDAMVSDRPYRPRLGLDQALVELERCSGTQFNPEVVAALVKVVKANPDFES